MPLGSDIKHAIDSITPAPVVRDKKMPHQFVLLLAVLDMAHADRLLFVDSVRKLTQFPR